MASATAAQIIQFLSRLPEDQEVRMEVWDDTTSAYRKVPIQSFHMEEKAQQDEQGNITGPAKIVSASFSSSYC